jgi:hypothetical protein
MRTTIEMLLSDLSGEEATVTVSFTIEGAAYEIDLTEKEAEEFRASFATYVEAARRTGGRRRPTGVATSTGKEERAAIKAWARDNGYEVSERGRIPAKIVEAYRAAHEGPKQKAPAKKTAAKKAPAKKAPAKKVAAETTTARKSTKKAAARKATPARKASARRTAVKQAAASEVPAAEASTDAAETE